MQDGQSPYLTPAAAAEYCQLSKGYFDKLRCYAPESGPSFLKIGNRVLYPREKLDQWLLSKQVV